MSRTRVVVTGIGLCTPIGHSLAAVSASLREGRHGIRQMPELAAVQHMRTRLGAPVRDLTFSYPRKRCAPWGGLACSASSPPSRRSRDAELNEERLRDDRTGIAYGSTAGSAQANEEWSRKLFLSKGLLGLQSTDYLKFMSHTCAANLAIYFGVTGRVLATCSACVSASQAIGAGYESIRAGFSDIMLCGGAEELHTSTAAVFDIMYATSVLNDQPDLTPKPFDVARDGLVVGEGAGTFVLESYEHARARGARIYAEILGYGTNCDGTHVTNPSAQGMAGAMRLALRDAELSASRIEYVNAHATATEVGDIAESRATEMVLGSQTPISSTKSFTGHTLGACGAVEAAFCVAMMREGWLAPNRTLDQRRPALRQARLRRSTAP